METGDFIIRIINEKDIDALQQIGRSTFYESFIDITPEKDMQEYLATSFNIQTLLAEIKDPNSIFYFVERENRIVGYGKINFNKPPYGIPGLENCMEIQRIYITKAFHGSGAAQKLMDAFFNEAIRRKLYNIWLSTGAFNNKALKFYEKYGFEKIGNHSFPVGKVNFEDVILLKQTGSV